MAFTDRKLGAPPKTSKIKPRIVAPLERSEWTGIIDQPKPDSPFMLWTDKTVEQLKKAVEANDIESVDEILEILERPCVQPKQVASGEVQGAACEIISSKIRAAAIKAYNDQIHDILLGRAEALERASASWAKEYKTPKIEYARPESRPIVRTSEYYDQPVSALPAMADTIIDVFVETFTGTKIEQIPPQVIRLHINRANNLTELPMVLPSSVIISNAPNLKLKPGMTMATPNSNLVISSCKSIDSIPDSLAVDLASMEVSSCPLKEIPKTFRGTRINVSNTQVSTIPDMEEPCDITAVGCPITKVRRAKNVLSMDLANTKVVEIEPGKYSSLTLKGTPLKELPDKLQVDYLDIQNTKISKLPESLKVTTLNIKGTPIKSIPKGMKISRLIADANKFFKNRDGTYSTLTEKKKKELAELELTRSTSYLTGRKYETVKQSIPKNVADMSVDVPTPDPQLLMFIGDVRKNTPKHLYRFMPTELQQAHQGTDVFVPEVYYQEDGRRGVKWVFNTSKYKPE